MLQLAHYMSNVIAPGAPDAALVSKTNYSSCIPSCTVGVVCCLRTRREALSPGAELEGDAAVTRGAGAEPCSAPTSTEGSAHGRRFSGALSWQLSQGIAFPALVTAVVGWELHHGIQFAGSFLSVLRMCLIPCSTRDAVSVNMNSWHFTVSFQVLFRELGGSQSRFAFLTCLLLWWLVFVFPTPTGFRGITVVAKWPTRGFRYFI